MCSDKSESGPKGVLLIFQSESSGPVQWMTDSEKIARTKFIEHALKSGRKQADIAREVVEKFNVPRSSAGHYVWHVKRELEHRPVPHAKLESPSNKPLRNESESQYYVIGKSGVFLPHSYKKEEELERLVGIHSAEVFGRKSFYFPLKLKLQSIVGPRIIDAVVFSLGDPAEPEARLVEYELRTH